MATADADVLIIGGGIVGAMTAWQAARRGAHVAVFDADHVGHRHGSSHGSGRIVRVTADTTATVRAYRRALAGWRELEAELGRRLLAPTEAVEHLPPSERQAVAAALTDAGEPVDTLAPDEATERWPQLRACWPVLCQPAGASVVADVAWPGAAEASRRHGASWHTPAPVRRLALTDDGVVVVTGDGHRWSARRGVLAAGAATPHLALTAGLTLPPGTVHRQITVVHQPADDHPPAAGWPVLRHRAPLAAGHVSGAYALPVPGGVRLGRVPGPDTAAGRLDGVLADLAEHARDWLPGLQPNAALEPACQSTEVTSGGGLYAAGPLAIAHAGDDGWFKRAPELGERLADAALAEAGSSSAGALCPLGERA